MKLRAIYGFRAGVSFPPRLNVLESELTRLNFHLIRIIWFPIFGSIQVLLQMIIIRQMFRLRGELIIQSLPGKCTEQLPVEKIYSPGGPLIPKL